MPEFLFAAIDASGNRVRGKATAADMGAAVAQVAAMGYQLEQIEQTAGGATGSPALANNSSNVTVQMPPMDPNRTISTAAVSPLAPIPVPPARLEVTQAIPQSNVAEAEAPDLLKTDAAQRRKVENDLAALGMTPDEIRRLVNANATTYEGDPTAAQSLSFTPAAASKSKRPTAASLESFAAQLNSANAAKSNAAVRAVDLSLPDFRESTTAETLQAETLLREANIQRRKENYRDAEAKVRSALALTPKDGGALELLGDILQGVGRVDEAIAAYKRATEADSKRSGAERKYGDLLMRQQNWNFADPEAVPPNRWFNSIVSLIVPGVGQMFNGDWAKALVFIILDIVCVCLLFYSPWPVTKIGSHASPITLASFALTIGVFIAAFLDSNISAARKRTQ